MTDSIPTETGQPIDPSLAGDIGILISNIAGTINGLLKILNDADVISNDTVKIVTTIISDLAEAIKKIIGTLLG
ncbi:hypothetical protein [Xenorhabdus sp. IM139775]|uniref:hypothetical protein n=1 Tax=Xenorhabdus sp. IM139775 TaxID=3025876 RepID=UPI002358DC01|nr:hypothetical protein [Xenorhabdus sp. IM139775]MDC9593252.1 hypothetical protein [Xenorhabdus sp. IM139775]